MTNWKEYRKTAIQEMRPYMPGEDLTGISVSERDTPGDGGMIARGPNSADLWYVSEDFFVQNYEQVGLMTAAGETPPKGADFGQKIIEVCDECNRACCYYGEFMCDHSRTAGTVRKTVAVLRTENNCENEYYWSDKYMEEVYGDPAPFGYES